MRIQRIQTVEPLRQYRGELTRAFVDYARRSKQPGITPERMWHVLGHLVTNPAAAVWFVLDDDYRFVGYAIATVGLDLRGPVATLYQLYLRPGRVRLHEIKTEGWRTLIEWAQSMGAVAVQAQTSRVGPGYSRLLRGEGFIPEAVVYTLPLLVSARTSVAALEVS